MVAKGTPKAPGWKPSTHSSTVHKEPDRVILAFMSKMGPRSLTETQVAQPGSVGSNLAY